MHVILYDGVCGLCNRLTRFVLAHDRRDAFRFASLQSEFARKTLAPHGRDPRDLDTLHVIAYRGRADERLLSKSRAALFVLRKLGFPWRLAALLGVLPTRFLDFGYDLVAHNRYRIFGRSEACMLPDARYAEKFIDA